jgi:hypothetical protein
MEWTDDLELFILKGNGKSLNYQMGVPLLEDVLQAMEQAIKAQEGNIDFLIFTLQCIASNAMSFSDFIFNDMIFFYLFIYFYQFIYFIMFI